jgi:hypothetical protein
MRPKKSYMSSFWSRHLRVLNPSLFHWANYMLWYEREDPKKSSILPEENIAMRPISKKSYMSSFRSRHLRDMNPSLFHWATNMLWYKTMILKRVLSFQRTTWLCDQKNNTCPRFDRGYEPVALPLSWRVLSFRRTIWQYSYVTKIIHVLVSIEALTGYGPVALPLS